PTGEPHLACLDKDNGVNQDLLGEPERDQITSCSSAATSRAGTLSPSTSPRRTNTVAIDRGTLTAQNERARSEHPRPRKGLRPRPRSIRTPRSIVLFQPGADAGTRKGIRMPGTSDPYAGFRLNFEQQRKRAKDLLRAVRAGDSAARRRLADALAPRAPDAEAVKLTDAQFAIARELGCGSWLDLRAHVMAQAAAREAIAQRGPAIDADVPTLHIRCGSDIK